MTSASQRPGLLSLPTELLLHILGYVVDHGPDAGLIYSAPPDSVSRGSNQVFSGLILDPRYSSSACLHILLVCRQLRDASTNLAFQRTVFVVASGDSASLRILQPLQHYPMNNLKNVILVFKSCDSGSVTSWRWPFNNETLSLDTLTIAFTPLSPADPRTLSGNFAMRNTSEMVELLRRLEHVRRLRFVQNAAVYTSSFRTWYNQLIGHLLKEDHYQRYDAPGAPHLENTWWDWQFNPSERSIEFVALPAKTIVPEPDYLEMVAPLIAKLMQDMEIASA